MSTRPPASCSDTGKSVLGGSHHPYSKTESDFSRLNFPYVKKGTSIAFVFHVAQQVETETDK